MSAQVQPGEGEGAPQTQVRVGSIAEVSGGEINIAGRDVVHIDAINVVVGAGLDALRDFIDRSPEVRAAVVEFRSDLEQAGQQVELLGDYKELHDILHDLQFICYNEIVKEMGRFPADEMAAENLSQYIFNLETRLAGLDSVLNRGLVARSEARWVRDVGLAHTTLAAAVANLDADGLGKGAWQLNRVLAVQPALVNTRLNEAAHNLRLPGLVKLLERVCQVMAQQNSDPQKMAVFAAGVAALQDLAGRLDRLVTAHDNWQALDVELRRIETQIGQNLGELQASWPYLKEDAAPLYQEQAEAWAAELSKDAANLDQQLAGNNPASQRAAFRSFRRRVGVRFYIVDRSLKDLCEELRKVSGPLAEVRRMLP